MDSLAKALVGLAALSFITGAVVALTGVTIMQIPAESFSRACENLALLSIALMLMGKGSPGAG